LVLTTIVFEGKKRDVYREEAITFKIAAKHSGIVAGAENGKNGFILTFVIAYIRDFCLKYGVMGESFETAVPWNKIRGLVKNVT